MPSGQAAGVGMAGRGVGYRKKRASLQFLNLLSLVFVFRDLILLENTKTKKENSRLVYLDTRVFFHVRAERCLAAAFPEPQSQEAWRF